MANRAKIFRKTHTSLLLIIVLTLAIAIYILNAPQRTGSSVARSNYATCSNSISTTISCTISTVTNGNTLVAVIGTRGSTDNRVNSISQSGANWVRATQSVNASGNTTEIWYTTSLSSAVTTITINLAEPLNASAIIAQYSGILSTESLDKTANNSGSSTTADTGTTNPTSQSNQLWIGGLTVNDISTFSAQTNNFVEIAQSASSGGINSSRNNTVYLEKIVTSIGTANTSASVNANQWSGAIATFNASGSPTQLAFVEGAFSLIAGSCSNAITIETRDSSGAPVNAGSDLVVQVSSNSISNSATYYTSPDCAGGTSTTTFTFDGTENSKTFFMRDTIAGSGFRLTATKISGAETLSDAELDYSVIAGSISKLGVRLPGQNQNFKDGRAGGSPVSQVAGAVFIIPEIRALDAYDNVVTSYSGAKNLTYSGPSMSPNNTSPFYTTNVNFSNGVSTTLLSTILYKAEDNISLTVSENGLYASGTSEFSVNPGILFNYDVATSSTDVIAGSCSDNTLDITAKDGYGNIRIMDFSKVLLTSSRSGIFFYSDSTCSNAQSSFNLSAGLIRIYWKPTKKTPEVYISATKNGDIPNGTSSPIAVIPAKASAILVKLPGQSFVDGSGMSGQINFPGLRSPSATAGVSFNLVLYAVDTFFNLVDSGVNNYSGTKDISWANSISGNSSNGTIPNMPDGSINFENGVSLTNLDATFYLAASNRNLRADDLSNAINGIPTPYFTVLSAAVDKYILNANSEQTAGIPFNISVNVVDAFNNSLGNLYSAPTGNYIWNSTASNAPDGTAPIVGNLLSTDFVNGAATKTVTLYKAEQVSFSANEPSQSTVSGTSPTIIVRPGKVSADVNDSTVVGNPTGFDSRAEIITITLKDTWRNPVPNFDKSYINVSATGRPSIEQPTSNTNENGITTALVTWIAIGDYTIRASINTLPLVQNDGIQPDADGFLDSTHFMSIYENHPSTTIRGGTRIIGGSKIR